MWMSTAPGDLHGPNGHILDIPVVHFFTFWVQGSLMKEHV